MKMLFLAVALCAGIPNAVLAQAPRPKSAVTRDVATPPSAPKPVDWRTPEPDTILVIDTNKGRIVVEMVPEAAPAHVKRVQELAREHFYDGLTFFRVIEGFMDQTGDPQNNGQGGSPKPDLAAEFFFKRGPDFPFASVLSTPAGELGFVRSLPASSQSMMLAPMMADGKVRGWPLHCAGVASMARANEPDSANSQFFLMRDRYPKLDTRYTAWGRVLAGQNVVTAIKTGEPVADPQDRMERVRLLSDLPVGERPKVRVVDTAGAWFKAEAARVQVLKGAEFSVCDINIPAEVK